MFVSIQTVRKDDTIKETYLDGNGRLQVEKGPATKVGKVETGHCSKRGIHINGRDCFDNTALVWRERGEPFVNNNGPSEEDWDIDNNIPASDPRSPMNPNGVEFYSFGPDPMGLGEIISVDGKPYSEAQFVIDHFDVTGVTTAPDGVEIQFQIKDGFDPEAVGRQAAIYKETMRQMSMHTPNDMRRRVGLPPL